MSVYTNPAFYKGPGLERTKLLAKDGQTWQVGQFGRRTDSGIVKCKSDASSIQFQFAEGQPTATSSSRVPIDMIPGSNTKFIIGVTNAGSDTMALASYIGSNEGLAVNASVCTLSTGNDSTEVLHIDDIITNVEGYNNDTNDVPGFVIASVVASALTAEGLDL